MAPSTKPDPDQDVGAGASADPVRRPPGRLRRLLARPTVRVILAVFAAFLAWLSWSVGGALLAPGNDSTAARLAEWGRDHHLGPMVTMLETAQYKMSPPRVGGRPSIAIGGPQAPLATTVDPASHAPTPALPPIELAPLTSPAGDPLPGEGAWRVLSSVRGTPAIQAAELRPDATHTSYLAGVVSMDPRLVRFQLHPGTDDPGPDNWGVPPNIPPDQRAGLLASFNGGFKVNVNEARGGFFLNGVTHGTLTSGAASLVFYKDGHATVGSWDNGVEMSPDVVGVRQNLRVIVDQAAVPDDVDSHIESGWGLTIGGAYFVWRSGVGVTADGRLVFVYGPALSVRTLANLLQQAGCVEAMQLDINPAWMSFNYYQPGSDPQDPTPVKLLPDQERPAERYFEPTSRDFTAVYAR
ncbi:MULTISPECIES: phosphodiester glycosidase family protein [unclassified Kitasatospora]|uniref:phosphodiester glycosidase family protein n=1 Tax=unclassified Kitasatospora TaxID=2633591 RepID=UPI0024772840|nr:phosphodiester glycosidase family protein [Kitasatospora sp. MAP12-44]